MEKIDIEKIVEETDREYDAGGALDTLETVEPKPGHSAGDGQLHPLVGRYHARYSRGAAKRDTWNPCRYCGWSEHMAIHDPKQPRGQSNIPFHAYEHVAPNDGSDRSETARKTIQ